jgi:hypothetical protein
MNNRKYIHLHLSQIETTSRHWVVKVNGKDLPLNEHMCFNWGAMTGGAKNLALAICKELYPGHENDLHEKFLKDYIGKLKDSDIVEVNVDITDFCKYARDVIRIKQEKGVESIEDCLSF